MALTEDFASPLPRSGRLEFDFVTGHRAAPDAMVLTNKKVALKMMALCLLKAHERPALLKV